MIQSRFQAVTTLLLLMGACLWPVASVHAQSGACCVASPPTCYENVSEFSCSVLGGDWLGAGSSCDACEATAEGACCLGDEGCLDATQSICDTIQGYWLGPNSSCLLDEDACETDEPLGACCVFSICIDSISEFECFELAGSWNGADTTCTNQGIDCTSTPINVPGDFETIQAAIDFAADGAEIIVAPGVYTGAGETTVDFLGKDLAVRSSNGPLVTFISGSNQRRGVQFVSGEPVTCLLEGFTVFDGYSGARGGGLYIIGESRPEVRDCIIRDCEAFSGAGAAVVGSSPSIVDCEFFDNVALDYGGAIEVRGASALDLADCVIIGNLAALESERAAINIRSGALMNMSGTLACKNVPTQLVGDWFDGGGNEVCSCPADLDGNGIVDGFDLTTLLANWGPCEDPVACEFADLNYDGLVDGQDLLILLSAWGRCP